MISIEEKLGPFLALPLTSGEFLLTLLTAQERQILLEDVCLCMLFVFSL